jgi:hypothetical protein
MHTKIPALILAIALSAPAAPAAAQGRWKEIGKTASGNTIYLDPRTRKTAGSITTVRLRVKFTDPVATPQGAWKTSQHIAMFDCAKTRVAARESWYYSDEAGTKIVKHDVIALPGYGSPIGGSMTRVALDYICKK